MQAQFEDIFKQMSAAAAEEGPSQPSTSAATAGPSGPSGPSGTNPAQPSADSGTEASFQETIRRTMERMQASGDQATAAATSGTDDDFMTEMLKQLSSGDLGGEGNEEEFSKMLMGMMEQLTNKDILYEPMKELDEKFPDWLAKNRDKTPAEDLKRYEEQQVIVRDIVARFEKSTYSDSNSADREFIVDKMQKVRTHVSREQLRKSLTIGCRCKLQVRLPLIWWAIWRRRRTHSTRRMKHVIHSKYHWVPSPCPFYIPVYHKFIQIDRLCSRSYPNSS